MENRKFKIWYQTYDEEGKVTGTGVYHKEYAYQGTALNVAHKHFDGMENVRYRVSILNPFEEHFAEDICDICGKIYTTHVNNSGYVRKDHRFSITSHGAIPPKEFHRYYSQYYNTCPDCIVKIKNFVDSLKATVIKGKSGCTWSDGLGTAPDGTQCGECHPDYAKRCPHLKEGKRDE